MGESLRGVAVGATGLVLGILAVASIPLLSWIIHKEVTKRVIIRNSTESELFPVWADPSSLPDFYLQIYPFHVKNPDDVVNGAKAILEQRGPYTYREYRKKEDIVFNDNGTVSYIERKWYKFVRNMSVGYDSETFTTVNIPLVALADVMRDDSGFFKWIVSHIIKAFPKEKLFIKRSVKEMVFGYKDELLSLAKTLDPSQFYTDTVGVLAGKNYSYDGVFTIFTGEDDINQLGKIDKFNGSSYIDFWTTEYANMINGSADGSVFPPFPSKDFTAEFFSMDICRSAIATYHSDAYVSKYNVKVHRYKAPKKEMEKPSLNPDNAGFCTPYGNCMGSGVMNISTCQKIDGFHVPIVISFPHFYMAEDQYVNGVVGMHPTSDLATEVDIEPTTGLVMQAFKKIQMNLYLQNSSSFNQLEKVRTTVFPILWVNESLRIDNKHAAMVKHELLVPQMAAQICQYVVIGVGVLLFLTGTFLVAISGTKGRSRLTEADALASDGHIQNSAVSGHPQQNSRPNGSLPAVVNEAGDAPNALDKVQSGTIVDVEASPSGADIPSGAHADDAVVIADQEDSNLPAVAIINPKTAVADNLTKHDTADNPDDDDTQIDYDDSQQLMSSE